MLEGKALVIAIMMLTAAPIAATDSGQIFIGDVKDNFEEMLASEEPAKVNEIIDDSKLDESDLADKELLSTKDSDVPCFTFEEWKGRYSDEEKVDDKRDESKENDRARGDDNRKEDDVKEDYYDRENWADKETISSSKYDGCLTDDEWTLKFESDKEESCFTFEDIKAKKWDEKTLHKSFFGRDKAWDREEKDWDDEWFEELGYLAEQCDEGDEEACDELLAIREEWANDDESEDETEEESEQDDDDDTPCNSPNCDNDDESEDETEEESEQDDDEADDRDEDEDFRLYLEELSNACDEGDEEACGELREIMAELAEDREENDWDRKEKDWDDKACLTKEEWKEVFGGKDRKDGYDRDEDHKERGPHRDAFVRVMLEELEYACEEENDEEACAELEEMIAEFEERDGDCDKERDDDESDEEDNHEDEDDESDGNDEDESNEE